MTRLLLVIAAIALAFGTGAAAATSLVVTQAPIPAQGQVTVAGACVSAADLSYTYLASDGLTDATASSGDASYVRSIVVTRAAGTASCVGTKAAIGFDNTSGTAPQLAAGAEDPDFVGDASSGSWTFILETLVPRNAIASWSTGDAITVTVY